MSKVNTLRQIRKASNSNRGGSNGSNPIYNDELRKELGWNNRFHLGKLPKYDTYHDNNFMSMKVFREQVKQMESMNKKKAGLSNENPDRKVQSSRMVIRDKDSDTYSEEMNIVQSMWEDVGVTEEYRFIFISVVKELNDFSRKEFFDFEIASLKKFADTLHKLAKETQNREKSISFLQKFDEAIYREGLANGKVLTDIIQCIKNIRIQSINIVNHFNKVRELCSYNVLGGKFDLEKINKSFLFDRNYLIKMKFDLEFLYNSSLGRYFNFSSDADPFMLAASVGETGKYDVPISEDMMSTIKHCQFVIMQDMIFYQIQSMKINNTAKKMENTQNSKTMNASNNNYVNVKSPKRIKLSNPLAKEYRPRMASPNTNYNNSTSAKNANSSTGFSLSTLNMNKIKYNNLFYNNLKENSNISINKFSDTNKKVNLEGKTKEKAKEVKIEQITYLSKMEIENKITNDNIDEVNEKIECAFENVPEGGNVPMEKELERKQNNEIEDLNKKNDRKLDSKKNISNKSNSEQEEIEDNYNFNETEEEVDHNQSELNRKEKILKTDEFKNISVVKEAEVENNDNIAIDNDNMLEDMIRDNEKKEVQQEKKANNKQENEIEVNKDEVKEINNQIVEIPEKEEEEEINYDFENLKEKSKNDNIKEEGEVEIIQIDQIAPSQNENKSIRSGKSLKTENKNQEIENSEKVEVKEEVTPTPIDAAHYVEIDTTYKEVHSNTPQDETSISFFTGNPIEIQQLYTEYLENLHQDQKTAFRPLENIISYIHGINPKILVTKASGKLTGICCVTYDSSHESSLRLLITHISTLLHDQFENVFCQFLNFIYQNLKCEEIVIEIHYEFINGGFLLNKYLFGILKEKLKFRWLNLENKQNDRLQRMCLKRGADLTEEDREVIMNHKHVMKLKCSTIFETIKKEDEGYVVVEENKLNEDESNMNLFPLLCSLYEMTYDSFVVESEDYKKLNSTQIRQYGNKIINLENGNRDRIKELINLNFNSSGCLTVQPTSIDRRLNYSHLKINSKFMSSLTTTVNLEGMDYIYNRFSLPKYESLIDSESSQIFHLIPTCDGLHSILVAQLNAQFFEKLKCSGKNLCQFFYSLYPSLENVKSEAESSSNTSKYLWIPCFNININKSIQASHKFLSEVSIKKDNNTYQISTLDELKSFSLKSDNDFKNSLKLSPGDSDIFIDNTFLISIVNLDILTELNIPSVFVQIVHREDFIK